jgi:hypothetical protein
VVGSVRSRDASVRRLYIEKRHHQILNHFASPNKTQSPDERVRFLVSQRREHQTRDQQEPKAAQGGSPGLLGARFTRQAVRSFDLTKRKIVEEGAKGSALRMAYNSGIQSDLDQIPSLASEICGMEKDSTCISELLC